MVCVCFLVSSSIAYASSRFEGIELIAFQERGFVERTEDRISRRMFFIFFMSSPKLEGTGVWHFAYVSITNFGGLKGKWLEIEAKREFVAEIPKEEVLSVLQGLADAGVVIPEMGTSSVMPAESGWQWYRCPDNLGKSTEKGRKPRDPDGFDGQIAGVGVQIGGDFGQCDLWA